MPFFVTLAANATRRQSNMKVLSLPPEEIGAVRLICFEDGILAELLWRYHRKRRDESISLKPEGFHLSREHSE